LEELVIRFGATEGPRNPTRDDVRKVLEDIEACVHQREDFSIEKVSNRRPDVINGRRVIRDVSEPPRAIAAAFYLKGNPTPIGWFVTHHASDGSQLALAALANNEAEHIEGMCCGGPLTVRSDCLVPLKVAHEALTYFVEQGDRSPGHSWVNLGSAIRFV
jgi:hypothetical protein